MSPAPNLKVLENQRYQLKAMYADDDRAVSYLFPDLKIDLTEIFAGNFCE